MNRTLPSIIGGLAIIIILGLYMVTYQVRFNQVAVVRTFGRAAAPEPKRLFGVSSELREDLDAGTVPEALTQAFANDPDQEPLSAEALLCIMAVSGSVRVQRRIKKYITDYSRVSLKMKGDDIKAAGIEPGPRYNKILRKVLHRKLEGKISSKREEIVYMRKLINKIK